MLSRISLPQTRLNHYISTRSRFAHRYAIWLPADDASNYRYSPPITPSSCSVPIPSFQPPNSGFLQAVQWVLAARHLAPSFDVTHLRANLTSILQRRITRVMLGQDVSIASLQALLLLSTWPSMFAHELQLHSSLQASSSTDPSVNSYTDDASSTLDPELLIGAMTRMCNQLHLEKDVDKALSLIKDRNAPNEFSPNSDNTEANLEMTLHRARMVSDALIP